MQPENAAVIAAELELSPAQVGVVIDLLSEGATLPFIARYRKEATGSLDEVAVGAIRDRHVQLEELNARKAAVLKSLETHGHLTDERKQAVLAASTLAVLEDIYLPYRPKRRTKATVAREKGLEPLAQVLFEQQGGDSLQAAGAFVDETKGVSTVEDALEGARHIMAEWVNEAAQARERTRDLFFKKAVIRTTVAAGRETDGAKYRQYFDWSEPAAAAPSHRILAMRRGEKEEMLNLSIAPPETEALERLDGLFVKGDGEDSAQVRLAVADAYRRLLSRSMETEIRLATKQRADDTAIAIFAQNLRQLLMMPPLGAKRVMGVDPGFRTGCKVVCLDRQGRLLHHETVYPHMNAKRDREAAQTVIRLRRQFEVEAVAVGNGTAGRETEAFLKQLPDLKAVPIILVNESGASVYSASEAARSEFPDIDLTVRGAVSIGRRLMDPLSELVKIDPKSIGVGQYQHDVDQGALKKALDDVVISCVNAVGVDVNRASVELLTYVSGLGPQLARNIVAHRNQNGPFKSRERLKAVARLGPKAFEQCAGFLRIPDGTHPLDASAVHPESYAVVDAMARDLKCTLADLLKSADLRARIVMADYVTDTVGLPTLQDILAELAKPGRDPRRQFESMEFSGDVNAISDLKAGLKLPGVVTNVTAFGAFVDIGVHQDGLVHISELADRFVRDPSEFVQVGQKVRVTVLDVDLERHRISLSMKSRPGEKPAAPAADKPRKGRKKTAGDRKAPVPFNNPFAAVLGNGLKK
jgi:uncharacterized protein